ncbi:unnamed protein product [Oppiella nova]|uniref:Uncharacterized protein n=1 Tax=Oppiella nova TaxID=334625 RepID=A0A7R9QR52_9ACAR|nr:unnamed protein product [Oppiella nova]CAG2171296.1 unnamed protein product [Oppiella nova]
MLVVIFSIIAIAIESTGLIGAYMESYCLCMTYCVILCFLSVLSVGKVFVNPRYIGSLLYNLCLSYLAYSLAMDCEENRKEGQVRIVHSNGVNNPFTRIDEPSTQNSTKNLTYALCKKWTLFAVNVILVLLTIVAVSVMLTYVLAQKDTSNTDTIYYINDDHKQLGQIAYPSILIIGGTVEVAVLAMGAVGAYRESYCLCMAYTVILAIFAVLSLDEVFVNVRYVGMLVINLALAYLAFSFGTDCRLNARTTSPTSPTGAVGAHNPFIVLDEESNENLTKNYNMV